MLGLETQKKDGVGECKKCCKECDNFITFFPKDMVLSFLNIEETKKMGEFIETLPDSEDDNISKGGYKRYYLTEAERKIYLIINFLDYQEQKMEAAIPNARSPEEDQVLRGKSYEFGNKRKCLEYYLNCILGDRLRLWTGQKGILRYYKKGKKLFMINLTMKE